MVKRLIEGMECIARRKELILVLIALAMLSIAGAIMAAIAYRMLATYYPLTVHDVAVAGMVMGAGSILFKLLERVWKE